MNTNFTATDSFQTLSEHLKNIWACITDDETLCYESNDRKFYSTVKEKYGLSREELRQLSLGRGFN